MPRVNLATLDPRALFPSALSFLQPPPPPSAPLPPTDPDGGPAPQNMVLVQNMLVRVEQQLVQDRARFSKEPESAEARECRNESLAYFGILNDWCESAKVAVDNAIRLSASAKKKAPQLKMQEAREVKVPVQASPNSPPEPRMCILDVQRDVYFIFVKLLRETIYGQVNLCQVGKMDGGVVKPSDLQQGRVAIKVYEKVFLFHLLLCACFVCELATVSLTPLIIIATL